MVRLGLPCLATLERRCRFCCHPCLRRSRDPLARIRSCVRKPSYSLYAVKVAGADSVANEYEACRMKDAHPSKDKTRSKGPNESSGRTLRRSGEGRGYKALGEPRIAVGASVWVLSNISAKSTSSTQSSTSPPATIRGLRSPQPPQYPTSD